MMRVVDLVRSRPDELAQARRIFTSSFNVAECLPWSTIEESLGVGVRAGYAAARHGHVVGMAVTLDLVDVPGMTLLEYLAVEHTIRSAGVGAFLLESVLARARAAGAQRLVLQVEHPDYGEDRATRRRRIRFYQRHGAHVIDIPVDRIVPDRAGPQIVPMLLLEFAAPGVEPLRGRLLADVLTSIWVHSYGRDADDDNLHAVIEPLAETETETETAARRIASSLEIVG